MAINPFHSSKGSALFLDIVKYIFRYTENLLIFSQSYDWGLNAWSWQQWEIHLCYEGACMCSCTPKSFYVDDSDVIHAG